LASVYDPIFRNKDLILRWSKNGPFGVEIAIDAIAVFLIPMGYLNMRMAYVNDIIIKG